MQNRYVGDIGDYVKLGILRALAPQRRLGVMWWLYPNEGHNADGKHIRYLDEPQTWRSYDEDLFDGLARVIERNDRRVAALEASGLLPGAAFASELIPSEGHWRERGPARVDWFARAKAQMVDRDLIFIDPDNGLETANYKLHAKKAGKSVSNAELLSLRTPGRALLVYHHQTRRAGGHIEELKHWGGRLKAAGFDTVDALRAPRFSPRAFFLLDGSAELRVCAERAARDWHSLLEWHPNLCGSSR